MSRCDAGVFSVWPSLSWCLKSSKFAQICVYMTNWVPSPPPLQIVSCLVCSVVQTHSKVFFALSLTRTDQIWCRVTILRDCSQQESSIRFYYIMLHLPETLSLCLATCRLSSHLPEHRCHIPARYNSANRHLLPAQHCLKGKRPSQRTE